MIQQFHSRYMSEENENTYSERERCMHPSIHCNVVYLNQAMETMSVPSNGWVEKDVIQRYGHICARVYIYDGMCAASERMKSLLFEKKKKRMDFEYVMHISSEICQVDKKKLYNFTYMGIFKNFKINEQTKQNKVVNWREGARGKVKWVKVINWMVIDGNLTFVLRTLEYIQKSEHNIINIVRYIMHNIYNIMYI